MLKDLIQWLDRSLLEGAARGPVASDWLLRAIVAIYPQSDDRRRELLAELVIIPRRRRFGWVGAQLATAIMDGLPARLRHVRDAIRDRRLPLEEDEFGEKMTEALQASRRPSRRTSVIIDDNVYVGDTNLNRFKRFTGNGDSNPPD